MALEISSSRTQLRSLTLIGTGALLFALVGYLFIKLENNKSKKAKSKKSEPKSETKSDTKSETTSTPTTTQQSDTDNQANSPEPTVTKELSEKKHVIFAEIEKIIELESIKVEETIAQEDLKVEDENNNTEMTSKSKSKKNSNNNIEDQAVPKTVEVLETKMEKLEVKNEPESVEVKPNIEVEVRIVEEPKIQAKSQQKQQPAKPAPNQDLSKPDQTKTDLPPAKPKLTSSKSGEDFAGKAKKKGANQSLMKSSKTTGNLSKELKKEDDADNFEDIVVYEFNFPRKLCGKLIGKNGVHVDFIRSKTHTQIAVRNDPNLEELQIVCVSGRLEEVDQALEIISNRFPAKHYPNVSFKPISKPIVYRRYNNDTSVLMDANSKVLVAPNMFVDLLQLMPSTVVTEDPKTQTYFNMEETELANAALNVHVTSVVNTAHVFIQLPSNPLFDTLPKLDQAMLSAYNTPDEEKIPLMSEPIEYGTICAAPTSYGWHRAMVTSYMPKESVVQQISDYNETCGLATIKFLDYGGYLTIPTNQLRQLRSDFMLLPFQAVECYLDGIFPIEGTEEKGKSFVNNLIKNSVIKAVHTGYAEDGVPLVKLYITNEVYQNNNLNAELVNYNYAFFLNDLDSYTNSSLLMTGQDHLLSENLEKNQLIKNEQTIN